MVVVLLSLLVFVLIVVLLVWDTPTKENTTKKNNKRFDNVLLCFVALWSFEVFAHRKANSPRPKKAMFSSFFSKHFFLQKAALGIVLLSFFFVCLCFFFCLNSGSHFDGQFRDHKTARPLFKLVFEGLNF